MSLEIEAVGGQIFKGMGAYVPRPWRPVRLF